MEPTKGASVDVCQVCRAPAAWELDRRDLRQACREAISVLVDDRRDIAAVVLASLRAILARTA